MLLQTGKIISDNIRACLLKRSAKKVTKLERRDFSLLQRAVISIAQQIKLFKVNVGLSRMG